MRAVRAVVIVLVSMAVAVVLAGCGGSSGGEGPEQEAIRATPLKSGAPTAATVIHIGIHDGSVTPSGSRVKAKTGSKVALVIDADEAGELHVHSSPEQHVEFPAGRSAATLTIDQPGIVDIEDHALDKLIVQLEVR